MALPLALLLGATLVGDYQGRVELYSTNPSREVRLRQDKVLAPVRATPVRLTLSRNGRFTLRTARASVLAAKLMEGRWSRLEGQVVLMTERIDGRQSRRTEELRVSPKGLILPLPPAGELRGRVVFIRAAR